MSEHAQTSWLVTYDMRCPRRLARVFRFLKGEGIAVQYSVFSVQASPVEMEAMMVRLTKLVDPDDDLRAYHLPDRHWQARLGQPKMPADVWLA